MKTTNLISSSELKKSGNCGNLRDWSKANRRFQRGMYRILFYKITAVGEKYRLVNIDRP